MAPTMLMTRNRSSILSTYSWWSSMFWNEINCLVNRVGWWPNNQITNSLFHFCKSTFFVKPIFGCNCLSYMNTCN
jgi:hypothetical protein